MRFSRVLVANRGEIAVRVLRGARRAGYQTVAVYTDADAHALHVRSADVAVPLGSPDGYRDIARIVDAARRSGAQAIHPGYGFLSERAAFARAVVEAGLVFVGPSTEAIDAMGDKSAAKPQMIAAGVPCIPGFHGRSDAEQTEERLTAEALTIGFPVMVKAAAGGGGRGMRLVHDEHALLPSLRAARAEALSAFGDGTLLLERALVSARHVEIQVFGDEHGAVVHLGERDCSVQRRNQKVVEESPSPAVDASLRAEMGAAAVRAAQAVGYVGAGTVEFMLDSQGAFYFLEMNTRLQVEHPVTELTYDVDLVEMQLRVAQGSSLPWTQGELDARRRGHAIEVRLCAEDAQMRPRTGTVLSWRAPVGEGIRVDSGIEAGSTVSAFYDSLLGKIIAFGDDRETARRRLLGALADCVVLGVETNRALLTSIIGSELFASGRFDTGFLSSLSEVSVVPSWHAALAAVALELEGGARLPISPSLRGWQSCELADTPYLLEQGEQRHVLRVRRQGELFFVAAGETMHELRVTLEGTTLRTPHGIAHISRDGDQLWLDAGGHCLPYVDRSYASRAPAAVEDASVVRARSDGTVVAVAVKVGDRVEKGQPLIVIESMKMQIELDAGQPGVVLAVHVAVGDQVKAKRALLELGPAST